MALHLSAADGANAQCPELYHRRVFGEEWILEIMSSWHSYPSSFNLGHRAVRDILTVPHFIEEKIDGSQFSMGMFDEFADQPFAVPSYVLRIRSKGAEMNIDAPEKMFSKAAETARRLASPEAQAAGVGLYPGWTYRCEYLRVPKHNTLAYDRVPANHLIVFDVNTGDQEWLSPDDKAVEARRLGLECVPVLWAWNGSAAAGAATSLDQLRGLLDNTDSVLGGQKIEGVVIKQFGTDGYLYGMDHKTLIGKFVSEKFREAHGIAWKESNPTNGDILLMLGAKYQHVGRWMKGVQHLREAGLLEDSPRDIGKLLIEIEKDLGQEEKEEIKTLLWKWAWPSIRRMATRGVAEWYKEQLLRKQFEAETGLPEYLLDVVHVPPPGDMLIDCDPGDEHQEPASASR